MNRSWPETYGAEEEAGEDDIGDQFSARRDAILFAIEATESVLSYRPQNEQNDQDTCSCRLLDTIRLAYELMRAKIISNPKDRIGLMVFNTKSGSKTGSNTWKSCNFLQDLKPVDAPCIKSLKTLIEKCERNPQELRAMFAPQTGGPHQIPEAFRASLNRFKECVPKEASKRLFWITDNPRPLSHSNEEESRRIKICMTLCKDLMETGIQIQPFFNQTSEPFEINDFYASVLECSRDPDVTSASETQQSRPLVNLEPAQWFEKLLKDASMREIEKRSAFKIPFKIGDGLEIGVSGFVLVVEEKRKGYIVTDPNTSTCKEVKYVTEYIDADSTAVVEKQNIVNYFPIGNTQEIKNFRRVIFTNEEVEKIRTLGLDTGLILLGFRPKHELLWKDHVKHSYYIYPNDDEFIGSTRAFSALLYSMAKKEKIGYGLLRTRKNDTPALVAILPQLEVFDPQTSTQDQPPGMHLCILPWADDMNPPPKVTQYDCFTEPGQNTHPTIELARKVIKKLKIAYAPNNTRNPALQYHYDFLAAKYLNEPFEPAVDQSLPLYSSIQERCGHLIKEFKEEIDRDPRAEETVAPAALSKKRRRIEDGEGVDVEAVESAFASRREKTLTVVQLKEYLVFHKQLSVGGKAPLKAELINLARTCIATKKK